MVTFHRVGFAKTYIDGALANLMSIAPDPGFLVGSVDTYDLTPSRGTGYAWNLGEDGTGFYAVPNGAGIDCLMDDVGIWRRILGEDEVAQIYQLGQTGKSFASAVVALKLQAQLLAGQLAITWNGGTGIKLQKTTSLSNPNWQDVAGSDGSSSASELIGSGNAFYRLIKP